MFSMGSTPSTSSDVCSCNEETSALDLLSREFVYICQRIYFENHQYWKNFFELRSFPTEIKDSKPKSSWYEMNLVTDHIDMLPDEILIDILKYLPLTELIMNVPNVCTRWKGLIRRRRLWIGRTLELPEDDSIQYVVNCFPRYSSVSVELSQYPWSGKAMFEATQLHAFIRTKECFFGFLETIVRNGEAVTDMSICGLNENVEKVLTLLSHLPNLKKLNIDGSFFIENCGIRHLADNCPWLTDIDTGELSFSDAELKYFLERKGRQLRRLGVAVQTAEGSLITRFLHVCCKNLTKLTINGIAGFLLTPVDDLTVFSEMKKLKQLHLHEYIKLPTGVLANAFQSRWFETLKVLIMDNATFVDDEVMTAISRNCIELCELQVNNAHFSGKGLRYLHYMKNLERLDLSFSQLMRTLGTLPMCRQLKELNLECCTLVSPEELSEKVKCLRYLQHLDLSQCRTSSLQLEDLPEYLPFLSVLVIYNTRANPEQIKILKQRAPNLKVIV